MMGAKVYYKATRLDGSSFKDASVKWVVGETVVHPVAVDNKVEDEPSTYLSVATVPTDCTGFSWPCRLFLVKGVGRGITSSQYPNKRGFSKVRVVEELESWRVFGPHGQDVIAVIERAKTLTRDEANRLWAAWGAARDAAWGAARDAAWDAALAYLVRDLITVEQFDILTQPWHEVIGDA